MKTFKELLEKKLTPAELKKREEIAKAMERENPGMDMGKKMAIATAAAKRVAEETELEEAASVAVTVQALAPADKKYSVTEIHPRTSPRGRTKWKDISYHSSEEEAKAAADAHAKKNNLHRMKSSVAEEVELEEATHTSLSAWEEHAKKLGYKVTKDNKTATYHAWKDTTHKGAFKAGSGSGKVEESKLEGTEMLSFKHFQVALEEAKKKSCKESEIENAHGTEEIEDEEEKELDEVSTATMSHQGKTTLKHVKNPGVELRMAAHDIKPGIKGYRDRVALMKAADAEKKLKEEAELEEASYSAKSAAAGKDIGKPGKMFDVIAKKAAEKYGSEERGKKVAGAVLKKLRANEEVDAVDEASPFDWKAYGKEKAKAATTSGTTKTYHDVKKTSTGTVYTKQSTPDGISKGSGEDAAKAEEPVVKRGRGRPAGVGAKAGSYKPRDPAKKAASAAKAAASKAANRAMRKESFDLEFMESLIEGFEDEDFDDFIQSEEFENLDETTQESLISFINEKCGYKMKESLTGNQHKLDKNKNGKLDSHDFKLLRKEETEQIQESVNSYAAFLTKKQ